MTFNKLNWTVALEVTSSFPSETTSITSLKTSNFQLKLPFCRCCISYYHSYLDFIISKPTWTRTTQQTRTHDRVKKNLFITFKTLGISVPVFIVQEAFRDVTKYTTTRKEFNVCKVSSESHYYVQELRNGKTNVRWMGAKNNYVSNEQSRILLGWLLSAHWWTIAMTMIAKRKRW